jgi:hypothetical protein
MALRIPEHTRVAEVVQVQIRLGLEHRQCEQETQARQRYITEGTKQEVGRLEVGRRRAIRFRVLYPEFQ